MQKRTPDCYSTQHLRVDDSLSYTLRWFSALQACYSKLSKYSYEVCGADADDFNKASVEMKVSLSEEQGPREYHNLRASLD